MYFTRGHLRSYIWLFFINNLCIFKCLYIHCVKNQVKNWKIKKFVISTPDSLRGLNGQIGQFFHRQCLHSQSSLKNMNFEFIFSAKQLWDIVNILHSIVLSKKFHKLGRIQLICGVKISGRHPSSFRSFVFCLRSTYELRTQKWPVFFYGG